MPNPDTLMLAALHRHWLLADSVRAVLKQQLSDEEQQAAITRFGLDNFLFGQRAVMAMRMQVWYGLLYVVIEGYHELGLAYAPLDAVLAKEEYVKSLKRYRNATFHYQKDPINEKIIDFLDKADSEHWIAELNKQLIAFFMQALPITETLAKIDKEGMPAIPAGLKLETLVRCPEA